MQSDGTEPMGITTYDIPLQLHMNLDHPLGRLFARLDPDRRQAVVDDLINTLLVVANGTMPVSSLRFAQLTRASDIDADLARLLEGH